jgi:von Willebrand factor type D domain
MKNTVRLFAFLLFGLLYTGSFFAQDKAKSFEEGFSPIRTQLIAWDNVRGEWLAQSLENVSKGQAIPNRTFPENYTPFEMLKALPQATQNEVRNLVTNAENTAAANTPNAIQWSNIGRIVKNIACSGKTGRTYGDPHLTSLDGASLSFQTVGEFTLCKSQSGNFIVQSRQSASGSSVSLNSAAAMWVNGNRVCFYGKEKPDGNSTTPVRVEGEAVYMEKDKPHFLSNGGSIERSGNDYIVNWPSGERVKVDMLGNGQSSFINLVVEVFPCNETYSGLLGNGNGRSNDD